MTSEITEGACGSCKVLKGSFLWIQLCCLNIYPAVNSNKFKSLVTPV